VSQSLNIRNVLLWLEGRHGDRRLHHWSMALSIALCSTPAHTSITCCIRIIHILHFCMADSLLNYAPDSVDKWLRSELFGGHKSGSSERWPWSLRLFHFRSGGSKWCTLAQTAWVNTTCRKRSQPEESCQNWYCGVATYVTKSLQMSEETNNPVYKLNTDKLQPVL